MSTKHQQRIAFATHSLLALLLGCSAAGAAAQTQEAERVELRGQMAAPAPRLDVHRSCPSIGEQLNDALGAQHALYGEFGTVTVQLAVDQGGVSSVQSTGGPRVYRRSIRQALQRMDCFDRHAGSSFKFQISFLSPEEAERNASMAAGASRQQLVAIK